MENLLEYQKLDGELLKLQKEINKESKKEESNNLYGYVKNAQTQTIQFDKDAKSIIEDINKLISVQAKGVALIEKYSQTSVDKLTEEELADLDSKINQAVSNLNELENRIKSQTERAKHMLQECDMIRKKAFVARQKYQENKTTYENLMKEKEPEIQKIKKDMEGLSHSIDPVLMTRYKNMRQDGIFPVVVSLVGSRCGGCRMELPSIAIEKLKQKGHIDCEQCRRIIYLKEEK